MHRTKQFVALVLVGQLAGTLIGCATLEAEMKPFIADCVEGETHRYDSGNGLAMSGVPIPNYNRGWSSEKWGDVIIAWAGGETLLLGKLDMNVVLAEDGVIHAIASPRGATARMVYVVAVDIELGEALVTQTSTSQLGKNRAVKVRSQNLACKLQP